MNNKLIGNIKVQQAILKALKLNALHHTLLFSGPKGTGKTTAAKMLSQSIFCESDKNQNLATFGGCGNCHNCKVILAGNMPDVVLLECETKDSAGADQVRKILSTLRLKPFSGKARVIIFDDAHLMSTQAANALLKSLEEPRPGTFFILVSDKPAFLLKTIHSRTQRWGFSALKNDELLELLSSLQIQLDTSLIELAEGSLYHYRLLTDNAEKGSDFKERLKLIASGNSSSAIQMAEELSANKETLKDSISLLLLYAAYLLRQDTENRLRWSLFIEDIGMTENLIFKRNLNPFYLLEHILLKLSDKTPEQYLANTDNSIEALIR